MKNKVNLLELDDKTTLLPKKSRDLFYRQENEVFHSEFAKEKDAFAAVANGDVDRLYALLGTQGFTIGNTTDDQKKTKQYAFITFFALAIRVCIENGLPEVEAYDISDKIVFCLDKWDFHKVEEYLNRLMARMREIKRGYSENTTINDAINYIYEHLHYNVTRDEIADAVGLNPTYLSTLFKKETGLPLSNFVVKAKIEEAKLLIKHKNLSTAEITYTLQFASESYFCTAFKKWVGKTPKEYRRFLKEVYR